LLASTSIGTVESITSTYANALCRLSIFMQHFVDSYRYHSQDTLTKFMRNSLHLASIERAHDDIEK
jgi:hypothetical protein